MVAGRLQGLRGDLRREEDSERERGEMWRELRGSRMTSREFLWSRIGAFTDGYRRRLQSARRRRSLRRTEPVRDAHWDCDDSRFVS
jgi:hypothetical protein